MNISRVTAAAQVLLAAQKRGTALAAPLAMALEAQQMLRFPEDAAELATPQSRVAELEKDTTAEVAGAQFTPAVVLVALARALREQPTGRQLLDGLDELGELSVCDGDPAEIASWVAALCHLVHLDGTAPVAAADPVVVYRAAGNTIGVGLYTTAEAAQRHCEALVSREYPGDVAVTFDWLADEEDGALAVTELVVQIDGSDEVETGYTVTPLEVATAHDPDADE